MLSDVERAKRGLSAHTSTYVNKPPKDRGKLEAAVTKEKGRAAGAPLHPGGRHRYAGHIYVASVARPKNNAAMTTTHRAATMQGELARKARGAHMRT